MRIASNQPKTAQAGLRLTAQMAFLTGLLVCAAAPAFAADQPALPAPALEPPPVISASAVDAPADVKKASAEDKVSDGAKTLIKKLDTLSDMTSLDDLNKARQAVARIEAMIDIEKKLGELERVRNDRAQEKSGKNASNLAAAIPASALTPPPAPTSSATSLTSAFRVSEPKPRPVASSLDVSRIVGSQGRYSATIMEGGVPRNVSVGDKVGGATVRSITAQAVTVDDGGETRTLRVKNVDTIFSAMR